MLKKVFSFARNYVSLAVAKEVWRRVFGQRRWVSKGGVLGGSTLTPFG